MFHGQSDQPLPDILGFCGVESACVVVLACEAGPRGIGQTETDRKLVFVVDGGVVGDIVRSSMLL